MKPRVSNILWGLLFVILGVGFAGNAFNLWDFNLFFPGWWTLFIIIPCFGSVIQYGPRTSSVIGLLIGILLLLSCQGFVNGETVAKLIFPIIFVIAGLGIMFSNTFRRTFGHRVSNQEFNRMQADNKNYSATFSGQNINFDNQVFEGANVDAIFGSVCLRMDQAIISKDVVINCNATFGGIELYLPGDVNVSINSTPIFGGVSNHRRKAEIQNAPVVFINATSMFGGVDIK